MCLPPTIVRKYLAAMWSLDCLKKNTGFNAPHGQVILLLYLKTETGSVFETPYAIFLTWRASDKI